MFKNYNVFSLYTSLILLVLHFLELSNICFVSVTVRRGVKRKWNKEEDDFFMSFFKDDITKKKMPTGVKILQAQKKLNNRSVAQIRTRVHNIMHEKQKVKKKT